MKTFRYKLIETDKILGESKINEFGRRGYELCGVIQNDYGYKYYFKVENNA